MTHALGMLLDFRKAKKTLACGSCLLHFPFLHNAILHEKPFGIPLIIVPEAQWAAAPVDFVLSYPWLTTLEMPSIVGRRNNYSVGKKERVC